MSMPSGHASSIFAVMTVIAKQYDHWYVAVPAYTLAGAVTFQRIDDKKHWVSDLLIGSTIGYLIASTLVDNSANHHFIIEPVIGTRGVGINLHF